MSPKLLDLGYEFFEFNSNCFECIPPPFFFVGFFRPYRPEKWLIFAYLFNSYFVSV